MKIKKELALKKIISSDLEQQKKKSKLAIFISLLLPKLL